jgi:adenosylcobinamide-GDP ribazoletransferase
MRGLILSIQFLTRLPVPAVSDFRPAELAAGAAWFPLVGALVGALVALAMHLTAGTDPWLGALCGMLAWLAITGGLHLDGLADVADAMGAAHGDPERFMAVLKDPHVGAFGVMALLAAIIARLVLLMLWLKLAISLWGIVLLAAWARWGALVWSQSLPSISAGFGERFAWQLSTAQLLFSGVLLFVASIWWLPALAWLAPLSVAAWWGWLRWRIRGMSGDCLGAGIEVCEILMLAGAVFAF